MASEVYEAAVEIRGAINRVGDLIEQDPFPERIAVALESVAKELSVANQLTAYGMMAGNHDRDVRTEIRQILVGMKIS